MDLSEGGEGGLWMYRTTRKTHKKGDEDKKTSSRITIPIAAFRKMIVSVLLKLKLKGWI